MNDKNTRPPEAYSYIRFSTPDQQQGDSERRQIDDARRFADQQGLILDETVFADRGVSGARGKNAKTGRLGDFLAACDSGKIKPGSWLLIENADRLTRMEPLSAFRLFSDIINRGITIATVKDGQVFSRETLRTDATKLMVWTMSQFQGYQENVKKAERQRAAWSNKRALAAEKGTALTRTCPLWLTVGDDGRYHAIPERVKVVKQIFELALEGLGARRIARRLNEKGVAKFTDPNRPREADSRGWSGSYVHGILTNDATIGVWRGHRIVDPSEDVESFSRRREQDADNGIVDDGTVYPAVVDKEVWLRAQELVRVRKGENGGRPKKPVGQAVTSMSNLFTGMCRCSCGAGLRYHRASMAARPKLVCSSHLQGASSGCEVRRWDYNSVETFLLYALANGGVLDFTKLFPESYQDELQATLDALHADREKLVAAREVANEQAERIVNAIANGTDGPRMHDRFKALEEDIADLDKQLPDITRDIERQCATPRNTERTLSDAREALQQFIAVTWQQRYSPGEAFGFGGPEEGYTDPTPAQTPEEKRDLREKLHHQLRGVIEELGFKANKDGSGVITLSLIPQGQVVMRLEDKEESVAIIEQPQGAVPPMELEDVPLEAGKGLGRRRLTKALLRIYLDGDIDGDPEAVQTYAV